MFSAKKAYPAALLLLLLTCWACPSSSPQPGSDSAAGPGQNQTQSGPADSGLADPVSADPPCGQIISAWQAIEPYSYAWGGESIKEGGFDCSGAIYHVQKTIGQPVPRTTSRKYHIMAAGPETHWSDAQCGHWIWWTFSQSRPYGHIGMHTGPARAWQSGSSTGPTQITLFQNGYWDKHFAASKAPNP